ncbi:SusC/RagA family TonB-linked outer membrane protein [Parapedobacter sp. DT-150]|uniref:SusC/RagA family TonB-linked outer membrane protein n=1 Tax=Parapedobacter sp. DT-150 TaxID=3396162 RepID=UPI003F198EFC
MIRKIYVTTLVCVCTVLCFAQTRTITGTVTDATTKEPLHGVTIQVKGEPAGTQTDAKGSFTLNVPASGSVILVVNYLGYMVKEVPAASSQLNISLEREDTALDEVIVVGYGTMRKRDLTGAVASVKAKDITAIPTTNVLRSLQGKVAGLDITQSSGQPGADVNLLLRGNRSLNASNAPLILVDGIQYSSFVDVNPGDIESIDVLKDVSSTAIYGTRGANGVIIITTKKGTRTGRTNISASAYASVNTKALYPELMNGLEYAQLKREAYRTTNNGEYRDDSEIFNATELEYLNNGQFEDWVDHIFHTGLMSNYEINLSGGSERSLYAASFGYQRDRGVIRNDVFRRYNGRLSLEQTISPIFKVGINALYTFKNQDQRDNPLNMAQKMLPIAKAYNDDGTLNLYPAPGYNTQINPLADEEKGVFVNNILDKRLFTSGFLDIKFHEDFLFKSTIGIDINDFRNGYFRDYNTIANVGRNSSSGDEVRTYLQYTWENTLNYTKQVGDHQVTALVGTSTIASKQEEFTGSGNNQASALNEFYDLGSNTISKDIGSSLNETALASFFGRVNYIFMDRYIFQASLRADGSSVLATGNKWGYFPSVSGAWRLKDEAFLQGSEKISELKLRVSWGEAGNSAIDPYGTLGGLTRSAYAFGTSAAFGYYPTDLKNPELTWETTATWDIGLDFGFFNNRIIGAVDFYRSKTTDLLLPALLPTSTGYASVLQNVGVTENRGFEVSLNTRNIESGDFNWTTDWSYTLNREKILSLNQGVSRNIANNWIVGEPLQIFYDYKKTGIWQLGEEEAATAFGGYKPGDIKILDANGNGISDSEDRVVYSQVPKFSFGINNSLSYQDVDLSVFVFGRVGQVINFEKGYYYKANALENGTLVDYWTPENPTNAFPRPNSSYSTTNYLFQPTLRYVDGSFIKIRDITLGYTLPQSLLTRIKVNRLRVYGTLQNYFVFSKLHDYDPERGGSMAFPMTKAMVFGVNLDF